MIIIMNILHKYADYYNICIMSHSTVKTDSNYYAKC